MIDDSHAAAFQKLRKIYVKQAELRFDREFGDSAPPEKAALLRSVVKAIEDEAGLVRVHESGGHLVVRLGSEDDPRTPKIWTLASLNHEYVVQLAVLGRLLAILERAGHQGPDARRRLDAEYELADLVLFGDDGGASGRQARTVLVQVEIKTGRSASAKEARDATLVGTPIHTRWTKLKPRLLIFASGEDQVIHLGRPNGDALALPEQSTWDAIEGELIEIMRPA